MSLNNDPRVYDGTSTWSLTETEVRTYAYAPPCLPGWIQDVNMGPRYCLLFLMSRLKKVVTLSLEALPASFPLTFPTPPGPCFGLVWLGEFVQGGRGPVDGCVFLQSLPVLPSRVGR